METNERNERERRDSMYLQWDEKLSVGVKEIDDRHQALLAKINELRRALMAGRQASRAETASVISFLETYVAEHFFEEEQVMERARYPFFDEHRESHKAFVLDLRELKQRLEAPQTGHGMAASLISALEQHMSDWFLYHIGNRDRKLAEFLSRKRN